MYIKSQLVTVDNVYVLPTTDMTNIQGSIYKIGTNPLKFSKDKREYFMPKSEKSR